jgi:hypothetical protein
VGFIAGNDQVNNLNQSSAPYLQTRKVRQDIAQQEREYYLKVRGNP